MTYSTTQMRDVLYTSPFLWLMYGWWYHIRAKAEEPIENRCLCFVFTTFVTKVRCPSLALKPEADTSENTENALGESEVRSVQWISERLLACIENYIGVSTVMGISKNGWLNRMIWGYPYFRKPPHRSAVSKTYAKTSQIVVGKGKGDLPPFPTMNYDTWFPELYELHFVKNV